MQRRLFPAITIILLLSTLFIVGCGASKTYVDQAVAEERARNESSMNALGGDVKENQAVLERMQSLTAQLELKTDMAINKATGFEDYQIIWDGDIYFDFNSTELSVAAREIVDQAGNKMSQNASSVMEIAGSTDPSGSAVHNLEIGRKRAAAAKYYLVDSYGINLYRIFMVSHGESKAVQVDDSEMAYSKQRKVIMKLWGKP